ncbi:MAG: orotidine-5'-phosphate decarboxylase [Chloroflexota bacterium]
MATSPFADRLRAAVRRNQSLLCVGLDPSAERLPGAFAGQPANRWMVPFVRGIAEATADLACCFNPNVAFYEAAGLPGQIALREILKTLPKDVPVLLDAKRGDIGTTSQAYTQAVFDDLGVDAVTVSPYLGGDALESFFARRDKGVFVLCKTSNAGSGELQDELLADGAPVYQHIARRALSWDRYGTLGLVVGATYPEQLAAVRRLAPEVPLLVPGVGAQAGDLAGAVLAGLDARGEGILVNASRSIMYASQGLDWQAAARAEAERLRDSINTARASAATAAS